MGKGVCPLMSKVVKDAGLSANEPGILRCGVRWEKHRPWELLPKAGDCWNLLGRAVPAGALGGAAEAEAAEADQTERTDQDHAEGGGFGNGGNNHR